MSSLLLASTASASFSFTVDSFTEDELVVTISGSSSLSGTTPLAADLFFFADTDGTSSFLSDLPTGDSIPAGPTLAGSGATLNSVGSTNAFGNVLYVVLDGPAADGDTFGTDVTLTFSGVGFFDFDQVGGELGLFWGIDGAPAYPTELQDSVVVPESSSYSLLFGLATFGAVLTNRRITRRSR